jgi:predicted dinucleotide-binding enzyme
MGGIVMEYNATECMHTKMEEITKMYLCGVITNDEELLHCINDLREDYGLEPIKLVPLKMARIINMQDKMVDVLEKQMK